MSGNWRKPRLDVTLRHTPRLAHTAGIAEIQPFVETISLCERDRPDWIYELCYT
jgi:hypothetical protein